MGIKSGWKQINMDIDLTPYLKTTDADTKYLSRITGSWSGNNYGCVLSISMSGAFNNFGNNGQTFNAVRDVSSYNKYQTTTGSSFPLNAASFGDA